MKVSDYIAAYLEHRGITHVFELSGGMITFLLDSLHRNTKVNIVSMHHEQAAGFAAEGSGRISGVPGIAMATSGPGATNLLTAIGSCYFDSVPAVFITGQVNRHEQKGDRTVRQLGFQETDIVSMARPVTKQAVLVNNPDDLPGLLEEAFTLAKSGRPGPVLLDIPMDVQRMEIHDLSRLKRSPAVVRKLKSAGLEAFLNQLQVELAKARRPLILAGGGIRASQTIVKFRAFADALQVPVVNSLMAVDVLPSGHPLRVGLIGSYGNRWANLALSESDFLLVLGSRLDVRQTGADVANFQGVRTIFHVDCESGELNNRVLGCTTITAELETFFDAYQPQMPIPVQAWSAHVATLREQWPDTAENPGVAGVNPNDLMHRLSVVSRDAAAYIVDVGQHQMWAAQSLDLAPGQRFLTSGGMGSMGFALPAAIGACFCSNRRPVVMIAGDGGFQCNIQELQTIVRNKLAVKMVVLNNGCHGMVRQFQESYFHGRYQSTVWGYDAPSFAHVANGYGLRASFVAIDEDLSSGLAELWADPSAPYLLEVRIDIRMNAYPKLAFGRPISEMEPHAKPLEMEGT